MTGAIDLELHPEIADYQTDHVAVVTASGTQLGSRCRLNLVRR